MSHSIRLLPFAPADGPTNMAADEALLETAAAHGLASLRFYTWTEPTLSLGYFQPASVVRSLRDRIPTGPPAVVRSLRDRRCNHPLAERADHIPDLAWVRRSTGGAAIVHHHELTYALALPAGKEWQGRDSWICRFHHLLRAVLAEQGVGLQLVVCGEERKLGEVLCFLHHTPGDLVMSGSKVAGSAQRKLKGALLQHGSLLLRRSEFAPMLGGMCDLADRDLFTPESLAELLAERLAADTGWTIEPGNWSETEQRRTSQIRAEKYAYPDWNEKR